MKKHDGQIGNQSDFTFDTITVLLAFYVTLCHPSAQKSIGKSPVHASLLHITRNTVSRRSYPSVFQPRIYPLQANPFNQMKCILLEN